jgi:prolipoprotein diacylglyceryltransferase
MLLVACVAAGRLTHQRVRRAGWDASHVDLALALAFLAGALGTKLLAVLLFDRFLLFALPLLAAPVLLAYCRVAHLPAARLFDFLAPAMLVWIALLRVGCFLAGCCWGDVTGAAHERGGAAALQIDTLPRMNAWLAFVAVQFPAGSFAAQQHAMLGLVGNGPSLPVLPTQLIEAFGAIGLCAVAVRIDRSRRADGDLALIALAGYTAVRFCVEFLRADNAIAWASLTGNQLVCLALLGAAIAALALRARVRPGSWRAVPDLRDP